MEEHLNHMLGPETIARELKHLCGDPSGPFQIMRRYKISRDALEFSIWCQDHLVEVDDAFYTRDLCLSLDQFSREKLKPLAQLWLERKGRSQPYRRLPEGYEFVCELNPSELPA